MQNWILSRLVPVSCFSDVFPFSQNFVFSSGNELPLTVSICWLIVFLLTIWIRLMPIAKKRKWLICLSQFFIQNLNYSKSGMRQLFSFTHAVPSQILFFNFSSPVSRFIRRTYLKIPVSCFYKISTENSCIPVPKGSTKKFLSIPK